MTTHPLLVSEDFDDLLTRATALAKQYDRPALPVPDDPPARSELAGLIESDCAVWRRILLTLLEAISIEKRAIQSISGLWRYPPQCDIELTGIEKIQWAPYIRHFTPDEFRLMVDALKRLWEAYHAAMESRAELRIRLPEVDSVFSGRIPIPDDYKREKGMTGLVRRYVKMDDDKGSTRIAIAKLGVMRQYTLHELRSVLTILRDFFVICNALQSRVIAFSTASTEPKLLDNTSVIQDCDSVERMVEGAKIDAEARAGLRDLGIDPDQVDRISDAQQKYIIWSRWRLNREPGADNRRFINPQETKMFSGRAITVMPGL